MQYDLCMTPEPNTLRRDNRFDNLEDQNKV